MRFVAYTVRTQTHRVLQTANGYVIQQVGYKGHWQNTIIKPFTSKAQAIRSARFLAGT